MSLAKLNGLPVICSPKELTHPKNANIEDTSPTLVGEIIRIDIHFQTFLQQGGIR